MKISLTKQVTTTIIVVGIILAIVLLGFVVIKLMGQKANLKIPDQYDSKSEEKVQEPSSYSISNVP